MYICVFKKGKLLIIYILGDRFYEIGVYVYLLYMYMCYIFYIIYVFIYVIDRGKD